MTATTEDPVTAVELPYCKGKCGTKLSADDVATGRKFAEGHRPGRCNLVITRITPTDQDVLAALRTLRVVPHMSAPQWPGIRLEETAETTQEAIRVLTQYLG